MTTACPARRTGAATGLCPDLFSPSPPPAWAEDAEEPQPVVVSATRVPTPPEQVASSVTVVTAADIEARQERTIVEVLKDVPGLNVVQTGGAGRHHLGVHARHQLQPHQGARSTASTSATQQLDRCLRLRPAADPGHRARRGAARPAERAVRLGRHRRGHQHHHQERQRADAVHAAPRRAARSTPSTRPPASAARSTRSTIPSTSPTITPG